MEEVGHARGQGHTGWGVQVSCLDLPMVGYLGQAQNWESEESGGVSKATGSISRALNIFPDQHQVERGLG